jgi:hypothetical protein
MIKREEVEEAKCSKRLKYLQGTDGAATTRGKDENNRATKKKKKRIKKRGKSNDGKGKTDQKG